MNQHELKSFSTEMADSYELAAKLMEGLRLPAQSKTVAAITTELSQPDPSFKKITDLINQDPGLVAQLLKTVNSPMFAPRREVLSVQTALSLLGLKNFYSLVMTSAVQQSMGFKGDKLEQVWSHSTLVAKLAERIAAKVERVSPDEAFLVGLFHDSAIPALAGKFPEYVSVIERVVALGGDIRSYEESHFNTHHALVGAAMARSWGLPVVIARAIRFHHADSLDALPDSKSRRLTAVLMLADTLARQATAEGRNGDGECERWRGLCNEIEAELGVKASALLEMAKESAMAVA